MVDWLEANRDSFNHPLSVTEIDWIMQIFTLTDRDRLYAGDEAAWTAFLSQMKRIWDMEQGRVVEDQLGAPPGIRLWRAGLVHRRRGHRPGLPVQL